ncbi:MAG: hypothetical protein ABI778_06605, partial [Ignavibacteriota bacterium]
NTVFYKVYEPHDRIIVRDSDEFSFSSDGVPLPTDGDNIVVKAITLCSERFLGGEMPKFTMELKKSVPIGAGLGGGSANAAAAIQIFSEFAKKLSKEEMFNVARTLGADVPFFLFHSDAAIAAGIGDELLPINLKINMPILIAQIAGTSISTAMAYNELKIAHRLAPTNFQDRFRTASDPQQWRNFIVNDFEDVAFSSHPILRSLKQSLYDFGAEFALMSGSGSAFFAIYKTSEHAELAREKLLTDYPETSVFISR